MVLEEVREHAETEEDVSLSLDVCYTLEKNIENALQPAYSDDQLYAGFSNAWSGRLFIPDHYSPPEHLRS